MVLVPCWQRAQSFFASYHDVACLDVLCPYCAYAEPATNAPLSPTASRNIVRVRHPAAPSQGGQR